MGVSPWMSARRTLRSSESEGGCFGGFRRRDEGYHECKLAELHLQKDAIEIQGTPDIAKLELDIQEPEKLDIQKPEKIASLVSENYPHREELIKELEYYTNYADFETPGKVAKENLSP